MSETKRKRGRPKKAKQGFLPGTEPEFIAALDDAADTYYDAMQERCRLSKEEDEAKDNLIDKMKEHRLERYITSDGKIVAVVNKSNVKVKRGAESNGEQEDE